MNDHQHQLPLIVDDYYEALAATVAAIGGFKRVGSELRPEMPIDHAGRWLSDCCNPHREHELKPSQLALIRRRARDVGVHILATWEMREAGYADPSPVVIEDEKAELKRQFITAQRAMAELVRKMERFA
jgi:hypothetical protein